MGKIKKSNGLRVGANKQDFKIEEIMEGILRELQLNYISDIASETNRQRVLQLLDFMELENNDKESYEKLMQYLQISNKKGKGMKNS